MRTAVVVVVTVWACAVTSSYQQEADDLSTQEQDFGYQQDLSVKNFTGVRLPRSTCDRQSFQPSFYFGDSACAAHCIRARKGFRGGSCRRGVCHCTKYRN